MENYFKSRETGFEMQKCFTNNWQVEIDAMNVKNAVSHSVQQTCSYNLVMHTCHYHAGPFDQFFACENSLQCTIFYFYSQVSMNCVKTFIAIDDGSIQAKASRNF